MSKSSHRLHTDGRRRRGKPRDGDDGSRRTHKARRRADELAWDPFDLNLDQDENIPQGQQDGDVQGQRRQGGTRARPGPYNRGSEPWDEA